MHIIQSTFNAEAARTFQASRQHEIRISAPGNPVSPVKPSQPGGQHVPTIQAAALTDTVMEPESTEDNLDPKLRVIKQILEALTGREVTLAHPEKLRNETGTEQLSGYGLSPADERGGSEGGLHVIQVDTVSEKEETRVAITGTATTSLGQSIDVNVSLVMRRESFLQTRLDLSTGETLQDPLVINLGPGPAGLSGMTFSFDIDRDGIEDELPWLSSQSGFLVFDRNNDRRLTDAGELFGPETGNGFLELERLDDDGNGWIDEADTAFSRLGIWMGSTPDNAELYSLEDAGIGALSVFHAGSDFSLKGPGGESLAKIRATGVYLTETGVANTVQQVDFIV